MKHSSLKFTCLLLALLTSGTALLACGGSGNSNAEQQTGGADVSETETATETEAPAGLSLMADADYNRHEFRILLLEEDDRHVDIMTAGEENGDIMNDLVFRRNLAVEEKYNITITGEKEDPGVVTSTIHKLVRANDSAYDLYFTKGCSSGLAFFQ